MSVLKRLTASHEFALFIVLCALFAGFALTVDGFFDLFNLLERSRYWVVPGLIAVAMTFVIATAGIDLSVASILALSGVVLGMCYRDAGWPIALACAAAIGAGAAAGLFNGAVSSYAGVPPLVVTLATMALFRGLAMGFSQADPISGFPESFLWLSLGDAFTIPTATGPVFVPTSLFALIAGFALGWLLLRKSWVGRFALCIGENPIAARFAAIDTRLFLTLLYGATGAACGVAAVFHTALFATAKADTAMGLELDVIACVVVGGTRISGGVASIIGTLFGLLIIGILQYGLDMAQVRPQNINIIVGALLIATVVFNEWMARRRKGGAT